MFTEKLVQATKIRYCNSSLSKKEWIWSKREDAIKTEEGMMKRFGGVAVILFLLLTARVYAQSDCDYVLSFENVSLSGTQIEDGYFFSGFSQYGYYLDICGVYTGNTTDSIYAELSDDSGVYWSVYGTIIWNEAMTRAIVQASYLDEAYSTYLDGTIKFFRKVVQDFSRRRR